jgi:hypothetical protein
VGYAGRLGSPLEPLSLSTVPVLQYPTRGQTRALGASVQCLPVGAWSGVLSWDAGPRPCIRRPCHHPLPAIGSSGATALRIAPELLLPARAPPNPAQIADGGVTDSILLAGHHGDATHAITMAPRLQPTRVLS